VLCDAQREISATRGLSGLDYPPFQQPETMLNLTYRVSIADHQVNGFLKSPCPQQRLSAQNRGCSRRRSAQSLDRTQITNNGKSLRQLQRR
jgi:hypothetical protein